MAVIASLRTSTGSECEDFSMCSNPGFEIQDGNFEFGDVLYGDEGNEKEIIKSCLASQKNAQSFRSIPLCCHFLNQVADN